MSTNSNRLPFYKPPQQNTNQYKFENADLDKVPVVQRFKNRNPNPQVTQGGRANQAGIKLGDTIVKINEEDTKNMSLAEAHHRIIDAGNDIKLTVKSFEDDEGKESDPHEVALEKKKQSDRENWIPQPERKVWHPIVWQQPPPPIPPELAGKDAPHRRIISNIYRFFRETENNPDARKKHIEDMLLALPSASKQF